MLGISQQLHDTIFAVGAFVLLLALLPAVVKKTVLPLSTIWITGGVLFVFALNYLTMRFWYAMAVEAGNVLAWAYLFTIAWKVRVQGVGKQEAA
jgi:hypothetical protein